MTAAAAPTLLAPAAGAETPELALVGDIARRALLVGPLFLVGASVAAGGDGAVSAGIGVALVVGNLAAAAVSITWAARINLALLMGVALFGYVMRLGVLFGAVLVLRELAWVHVPSLGLTVAIMHLGLLLWELKYVSLSLSHPGLEPDRKRSPSK